MWAWSRRIGVEGVLRCRGHGKRDGISAAIDCKSIRYCMASWLPIVGMHVAAST